MDQVFKLFGIFAAMGLAGATVYAAVMLVNVLAKRFDRADSSDLEALRQDVTDLHGRLEEQDQLRGRVLELEERLDFAERLLAQAREPARLPAAEEG